MLGPAVAGVNGPIALAIICCNRYRNPMKLQAALKQTKPFTSREHEVYLALERVTSDLREQFVETLLKPVKLSGSQYNVLRILRGAGDDGLPSREIGERLVSRATAIRRLLAGMQKRGP